MSYIQCHYKVILLKHVLACVSVYRYKLTGSAAQCMTCSRGVLALAVTFEKGTPKFMCTHKVFKLQHCVCRRRMYRRKI